MFGNTPPVVKNLLIINALMFLATYILNQQGYDLVNLLGLHHWSSELFNPFQFISYMFMHGGLDHIFFNMFAFWMFGRVLEQVWGSKRFLIYYLITGVGAGLIQLIVTSFGLSGLEEQVYNFQNAPTPEAFKALLVDNEILLRDHGVFGEMANFLNTKLGMVPQNSSYQLQAIEYSTEILRTARNIGTVGASGSVFGILLAFGMLFPNTELLLLFPPIPIKAKYFVIGYGAIELFLGVSNNPGDNVAHFAHLGGMLFGYILIKYWKRNSTNFF